MEILFCLWTRIAFAISGEWCLLWLRTFLASDFQLVNPSLGLQYGLWIVNTQISVCNTSFFSSDKESPEKFVCKQNSTTNFGRFDGNYQLAPICRPFGKKKSNLHGFVLQRFHLFHIFSIKWRNKTALHENVEENSLEREREVPGEWASMSEEDWKRTRRRSFGFETVEAEGSGRALVAIMAENDEMTTNHTDSGRRRSMEGGSQRREKCVELAEQRRKKKRIVFWWVTSKSILRQRDCWHGHQETAF